MKQNEWLFASWIAGFLVSSGYLLAFLAAIAPYLPTGPSPLWVILGDIIMLNSGITLSILIYTRKGKWP